MTTALATHGSVSLYSLSIDGTNPNSAIRAKFCLFSSFMTHIPSSANSCPVAVSNSRSEHTHFINFMIILVYWFSISNLICFISVRAIIQSVSFC